MEWIILVIVLFGLKWPDLKKKNFLHFIFHPADLDYVPAVHLTLKIPESVFKPQDKLFCVTVTHLLFRVTAVTRFFFSFPFSCFVLIYKMLLCSMLARVNGQFARCSREDETLHRAWSFSMRLMPFAPDVLAMRLYGHDISWIFSLFGIRLIWCIMEYSVSEEWSNYFLHFLFFFLMF